MVVVVLGSIVRVCVFCVSCSRMCGAMVLFSVGGLKQLAAVDMVAASFQNRRLRSMLASQQQQLPSATAASSSTNSDAASRSSATAPTHATAVTTATTTAAAAAAAAEAAEAAEAADVQGLRSTLYPSAVVGDASSPAGAASASASAAPGAAAHSPAVRVPLSGAQAHMGRSPSPTHRARRVVATGAPSAGGRQVSPLRRLVPLAHHRRGSSPQGAASSPTRASRSRSRGGSHGSTSSPARRRLHGAGGAGVRSKPWK